MAYFSMSKEQLEAVKEALLMHIMQPYTEMVQFIDSNRETISYDKLKLEDINKAKSMKQESIIVDSSALTEVNEALKDIANRKVSKQ